MNRLIIGLILSVMASSPLMAGSLLNAKLSHGYVTVIKFEDRIKIEYKEEDVPAGFAVTTVGYGIAIKTLSPYTHDNEIPLTAGGLSYTLNMKVVNNDPDLLLLVSSAAE